MDATSFWFNLVPAGSGRFRVGSAFYIHPLMLICFLCFTSLVSVTGSYTEDEPKTETCRLCRPCRLSTLYSCFCIYFWPACFGFGHKWVFNYISECFLLLCTGHASSQTRSSFPGSLLNFSNTTNTKDRPTVDGTDLAKCTANLLATIECVSLLCAFCRSTTAGLQITLRTGLSRWAQWRQT